MDTLDRLLLAVLGGGLIIYGLIKRGATKRPNPLSGDPQPSMMEVPDPDARAGGTLSLVIGAVFVAAAIFR